MRRRVVFAFVACVALLATACDRMPGRPDEANRFRRPAEVDDFFRRHPGSLVMVEEEALGKIFPGGREEAGDRILRELPITGDAYLAIGPP